MNETASKNMSVYRGWRIGYAAGVWSAHRFGVRLRAHTRPALCAMIDNRAPYSLPIGQRFIGAVKGWRNATRVVAAAIQREVRS